MAAIKSGFTVGDRPAAVASRGAATALAGHVAMQEKRTQYVRDLASDTLVVRAEFDSNDGCVTVFTLDGGER